MRIFLIIILILTTAVVNISAQKITCDEITNVKNLVYGFNPSDISSEEYQTKRNEVNRFWSLVRRAGKDGVDCLKTLLEKNNDNYFFNDGAYLLFRLDQSEESLKAINEALLKVDLDSIQKIEYVNLLLDMSIKGFYFEDLAIKYLRHPEVDKPLYPYIIEMDRQSSVYFIYGSMPGNLAEEFLVNALKYDIDYVKKNAINMLLSNMTLNSFQLVDSIYNDPNLSEDLKKEIVQYYSKNIYSPGYSPSFSRKEILNQIENLSSMTRDEKLDFIQSAIHVLNETDLSIIQDARRGCLTKINKEQIGEYLKYTMILKGIIERLNLYSNYRDFK